MSAAPRPHAPGPSPGGAAARVRGLSHRYGRVAALEDVSLDLPAGRMVGLIGPDGVGKSTLLSLIAGARAIQTGLVEALGGDMADPRWRRRVCARIAYMPQGLGGNLYPTLSVAENIDFFARLYGQDARERRARIDELTRATGLHPFLDRPAAKLSGGMKQKLSLCCALVHDPDLLILDEPTTGVDPLSRRQFWRLIARLRARRPGMTVLAATAYMSEAEGFDHLAAMDAGRVLAAGAPAELMARAGAPTLERAYAALLAPARGAAPPAPVRRPFVERDGPPAIEARGLTMRFGDFTAVDHVSFRIRRGEIFGFLGSNGCGKTTTMKMLTGLLDPTEGQALLFGAPVRADDLATRRRVGYMSQSFSLYAELSVRANLELHADLFDLRGAQARARVEELLDRFELREVARARPADLPLGVRQRLQLAVAVLHRPEILILDEPTSGVDPIARDRFWALLTELSRDEGVTIFVSTHFMNEAERCDRVSLMHAGRVLAQGAPDELRAARGAATLEDAFVAWLAEAAGLDEAEAGLDGAGPDETRTDRTDAAQTGAAGGAIGTSPNGARVEPGDARRGGGAAGAGAASAPGRAAAAVSGKPAGADPLAPDLPAPEAPGPGARRRGAAERDAARALSFRRIRAFALREALELIRDPIRIAFALGGPLILMLAMGLGISFDVENLSYAALDQDDSPESRLLLEQVAGSRYFAQKPPLTDFPQIDARMARGEIGLALVIPPGFGRALNAGRTAELGMWLDGSDTLRAETSRGYAEGAMADFLALRARRSADPAAAAAAAPPYAFEPRFRYNQAFESRKAIPPGVLMMQLIMVPAMLAALGVVREKETGSIANFRVGPAGRLDFLIGKQAPYVAVAMVSFLLLTALMAVAFGLVPRGDPAALALGALAYVAAGTGFGLLISAFVRTQIAAIFASAIIVMIPTVNFSGMLYPAATLTGAARIVGQAFPALHFQRISAGVYNKALGMAQLWPEILVLAGFAALHLLLAAALLRKQER
ncbi:ribosome-associated ATPase/putative transporter RbbA [Oceanicella actignis]|uniref:Ribosome-dependent ATPase n=1 Tax=Oceanicella actignis TaxID=1189325 RepID=A0A1M7TMW5_9RHOB|nr:ribosome-associated ATPase/putative transporter RbbA [Oceanicella actignis]SET71935.1 ribosome-dependent ATPase [Oceanicella actignis]SHN72089.1 ribosome-dependent ATPase [Oceanicella actignis]